MAFDSLDAVTARKLLEDAIAATTKPVLTTLQVDRAFALASSLNATGAVVYLASNLDKAAAWAWGIKAGLASALYEKLGGGAGVVLERSKLVAYCIGMADRYRSGDLSVVGQAASRSGIGSVGIIGTMAVEELL